jgi:nicotinamide mononucleotide transporter
VWFIRQSSFLLMLLDKDYIIFEILNYRMSLIECLGTIFNLVAVILSAKEKISSWAIGIIGVVLFFILFYQVQLYADMLLQVFFLITNCIGWYQWANPTEGLENSYNQLKITTIDINYRVASVIGIMFLTATLGRFFLHIHEYFPNYFSQPASFPYADSFVMAGSILAQLFLMQKKLESWFVWCIVNIAAVIIYTQKGIYLTALLYFVFLLIAIKGQIDWHRTWKNENPSRS